MMDSIEWDRANSENERRISLERLDAAREALLAGAKKIEELGTNEKYAYAMKRAARELRVMAGNFLPSKGTDDGDWI